MSKAYPTLMSATVEESNGGYNFVIPAKKHGQVRFFFGGKTRYASFSTTTKICYFYFPVLSIDKCNLSMQYCFAIALQVP